MKEKRSLFALVIIMTVIALTVMIMTNIILYQVAFNEKSNSLIQTAQSQARLIEAMARFNRRNNRIDWEVPVGERGPTSLLSERAAADTIEQLRDAHNHYIGFGKTGEFVIAGIENEEIVFLMRHRHTLENELESIPLYSENAEPIRRALFAQSGIMVGKDYRGVKVLAAYEPVDVLNFGIVAKVDLAEIQAPFITGVIKTLIAAVLLILFGSLLFRKITNPIISKIQKSEEQYRTLVEDINEWVWATDVSGNLSFSSAQAAQVLGYSNDELIGRSLLELIETSAQEKTKLFLIAKTTKKRSIIDYEVELVAKDKRVVPMAFSANPFFSEQGEFIGYRGIAHDISERKQAERLRLQYQEDLEHQVKERTQELHDINDEMKSFTYIVSHDLRSPLVSIMGFCGEIKDDMAYVKESVSEAELPPNVLTVFNDTIPESLDFIDASANKINDLINNILTLSRVGERKLNIETIDVALIVQSGLKAFAYQLEDIKIMVGSLPEIQSDAIAIEQIISNLLGNAIKFLDPERPGEISIWCEISDRTWTLCIKDNGVGIAQKDLPHIFELFKRIGSKNVVGEGMGLTYVHSLVKRLGGHIECESVVNQGTQFSVVLPKDQHRIVN